jgi:CyaY protein
VVAVAEAAAVAEDAFALGFRTSGPFCPQPVSNKPMVTNAAIAKGAWPLATKLSECSDIKRILLTMPSAAPHTPLSDAEFRQVAGAVLAGIEATVDRWLQNDVIDIDANRTGGMLELSFPDGSKIVVNTQPPLQEVWLAARGGGYHYRWVDGLWRDTRDGGEFLQALSFHASAQGGKALNF